MNKKVFVILFCIVLLFCGCATPLQNGVITDLGICSAENTYISKNARNPWDITIIDNDVYLIGASVKDLGKKWFGFTLMESTDADELLKRLRQ